MSDTPQSAATGPRHRWVEAGLAVLTALLGLIVILGSLQVGIGWGVEGPRAGFFPFYVGLLIVGASAFNLAQSWLLPRERLFAEWEQLRQVLAVVVPTALYVAVVPSIGIYLASMLLIAIFMKWLGRYGWGLVLAVSIGVPVVFFFMFEKWFLVPLPKGPIEEFFGL
jgi:hypothetical protein